MSPLEIPGTSIQIPYPPGKARCSNPKCKRDYNEPKVKKNGDTVTVYCPWCLSPIKTYSAKSLEASQKKKSGANNSKQASKK